MNDTQDLQVELKKLITERADINRGIETFSNNILYHDIPWKRGGLKLYRIDQRISDIRYHLSQNDDTYSSEYFCHALKEF